MASNKPERDSLYGRTKSNTDKQKVQYFYAMRKLDRTNTFDHWQPYQIELLAVQGDTIIRRELIDKPDTKQMVFAKLVYLIDPQNIPETDNATNVVSV